MAFTDRFLRVPIMQVNSEQSELMGKEDEFVECVMDINPRRIESMAETIPLKDWNPNNKIWTSVVMESGESFVCRMPLAKFKELLNKHTQ